jgi:NAD(P)-dependent dehydrogenase (short-subunit alcohol dehydrogenase family)
MILQSCPSEIQLYIPQSTNQMASYLITGCSRGLGLAITSHLLSFPTSEVGTVIATSRSESPALEDLVLKSGGRAKYIQLDATNEAMIKESATEAEQILGEKGLDVLINNAGMLNFTPGGIASM